MAGLHIKQKRRLHLVGWIITIVILALLGVAGYFGYRWFMTGELPPIPMVKAVSASTMPDVDETPVNKSQVDAYSVPATNPRYISIDTIGISKTRVYPVGITKTNMLDTPKNIHDAAWYNKSAQPGSGYGVVLLDAHNGGYSKDGIFSKLHALSKDDIVTIERGDGKVIRYKVVSNETMNLDDVNARGMKEIMQPIVADKEGLGLITCAGNYVPRLGQFDKRVMVRAVVAE